MKDHPECIRTIDRLLGKGFISTAFQPIFETRSGCNCGYESLLRGPENTPLSQPGRLFNDTEYLPLEVRMKVDRACIESAVRTARHLPVSSLVFINVLGNTLIQLAENLNMFVALLGEIQLDPSRIVFEISETASRKITDEIVGRLELLRAAGFRIALDDIGVRSPYLCHILFMKPEFIKMDRIFVQGIDTDKRRQDLVYSMVCMSERLGARLVAEGVETIGELETVKMLGVPFSQGFLLGRPLPAQRWIASSEYERPHRADVQDTHSHWSDCVNSHDEKSC